MERNSASTCDVSFAVFDSRGLTQGFGVALKFQPAAAPYANGVSETASICWWPWSPQSVVRMPRAPWRSPAVAALWILPKAFLVRADSVSHEDVPGAT